MNIGSYCARQACHNIVKNTGGNSYIGRYWNGQISANNIGVPIYRSVSNPNNRWSPNKFSKAMLKKLKEKIAFAVPIRE